MPPEGRVRDRAVFEVVEVDLIGPLHLADGSRPTSQASISKAVHSPAAGQERPTEDAVAASTGRVIKPPERLDL
ncbi:hypothetical protein NPIL_448261 [Nephila pilipes]|uniref:Uncharacterized protein n=1 Tax=Nephila pilipes TaxID=299642 RepID=A0A8X6MGF0_NEPPI|nr:hypothetical protein NPIL_448261 [Nephila pilipes]